MVKRAGVGLLLGLPCSGGGAGREGVSNHVPVGGSHRYVQSFFSGTDLGEIATDKFEGFRMEADVIGRLFEYGVLGLWTVTLLMTNKAMSKRHSLEREEMYDMRAKMQAEVIAKLDKIHDDVQDGLRAMREKYQEERMERMIRTRGYRTQTSIKARTDE